MILLLSAGVNVNTTRTDTGATPLYAASFNGHASVVELLLAADAIVDQRRTDDGMAALHAACSHGSHEMCVD